MIYTINMIDTINTIKMTDTIHTINMNNKINMINTINIIDTLDNIVEEFTITSAKNLKETNMNNYGADEAIDEPISLLNHAQMTKSIKKENAAAFDLTNPES